MAATPIGRVSVIAEGDTLVGVTIDDAHESGRSEAVRTALSQLEAWFAGEREAFDLRLAAPTTPRGATTGGSNSGFSAGWGRRLRPLPEPPTLDFGSGRLARNSRNRFSGVCETVTAGNDKGNTSGGRAHTVL